MSPICVCLIKIIKLKTNTSKITILLVERGKKIMERKQASIKEKEVIPI